MLPFLARKIVEILRHHTPHHFFLWRVATTFYLQQHTFLQRACANARRIHLLQALQQPLNVGLADVNIMIDAQLLADVAKRCAQQSVFVERLDEIFQYVAVGVAELLLTHLCHQHVVERLLLCEDGLLLLVAPLLSALINGQFLVVAPNVFQCGIESVAPFLAFSLCIIVVGRISVFGRVGTVVPTGKVIVGHRFLQCRIVVQLCLNALLHLLKWQLHQLRHKQLLRRDGLQLPLLLLLFLYLNLIHCVANLVKIGRQLCGQRVQILRFFVAHALPYLLTRQ